MNGKNKVLEIVKQICNTQSLNCRGLNKIDLALELLKIANVPTTATIQEIPLDWDNQVVILFTIENDSNYYSLFSGIGKDGNYYFMLTIDGTIKNNDITFYDQSIELSINYFVTNKNSMNNRTKFISQLSANEQTQIKEALMNCEELENVENKMEIINNAMDDRICLLENFINLELIIPDNLQTICNNWEIDFKGDLLENINDELETYEYMHTYIKYLIEEVFPIWIEESLTETPENTQLYIDYQNRLQNIIGEL